VLRDVVTAVPTAELEPSVEGHVQQDEVDMGMTYQGTVTTHAIMPVY
jgi:NH3-dependent NAD+ synthetase